MRSGGRLGDRLGELFELCAPEAVLGSARADLGAPARRVDVALLGLARGERGLLGGLAAVAAVLVEPLLDRLAALAEVVAGWLGDPLELGDPLVDGAPLGPLKARADLGTQLGLVEVAGGLGAVV